MTEQALVDGLTALTFDYRQTQRVALMSKIPSSVQKQSMVSLIPILRIFSQFAHSFLSDKIESIAIHAPINEFGEEPKRSIWNKIRDGDKKEGVPLADYKTFWRLYQQTPESIKPFMSTPYEVTHEFKFWNTIPVTVKEMSQDWLDLNFKEGDEGGIYTESYSPVHSDPNQIFTKITNWKDRTAPLNLFIVSLFVDDSLTYLTERRYDGQRFERCQLYYPNKSALKTILENYMAVIELTRLCHTHGLIGTGDIPYEELRKAMRAVQQIEKDQADD